MNFFKPTIYKKNIYEINYKKLKKMGITCLVFDLDNTLGLYEHKKCPDESKKLIEKLQKDFLILIASNNTKKRIKPYLDDLGVGGVSMCMKPLTFGLARMKKKYNLKKSEMVIIGDQIVTDIVCGKRFRIKTILVDPLGEKDLKITGLNRKIEKFIIKIYSKQGKFERGKYYE
ncbi:MAG: YqeG family HAD IIIA-type phosphatase [Firmicutes bacterium]|nr:YqeG family HAD IIIA-type phosphatase [Bacillota bacterium]